MPLYDFRCPEGHTFERMVRLENFQDPQHCTCGEVAARCISAPRFSVDYTDYTCPVTGKYIGSKHAHENNLATHGCRVLETGEKEANASRRQADEDAFDKSVEATVEKAIDAMSSDQKESLHRELVQNNVSVEAVRS